MSVADRCRAVRVRRYCLPIGRIIPSIACSGTCHGHARDELVRNRCGCGGPRNHTVSGRVSAFRHAPPSRPRSAIGRGSGAPAPRPHRGGGGFPVRRGRWLPTAPPLRTPHAPPRRPFVVAALFPQPAPLARAVRPDRADQQPTRPPCTAVRPARPARWGPLLRRGGEPYLRSRRVPCDHSVVIIGSFGSSLLVKVKACLILDSALHRPRRDGPWRPPPLMVSATAS